MEMRDANYYYMLAGLLVTLALAPVFKQLFPATSALITYGAFTATMLIGTWTLLDSRWQFQAGLGLAAVSLAATVYRVWRPTSATLVILSAVMVVFCLISSAFILGRILRGPGVDGNRLTGAACVYLLLGILFSQLNMLLFLADAESFKGLSAASTQLAGPDLLYYSFVTMTTLGYGDIVPASPVAKALAYLTAVAGHLYVAILIGALVGQYLRREAD